MILGRTDVHLDAGKFLDGVADVLGQLQGGDLDEAVRGRGLPIDLPTVLEEGIGADGGEHARAALERIRLTLEPQVDRGDGHDGASGLAHRLDDRRGIERLVTDPWELLRPLGEELGLDLRRPVDGAEDTDRSTGLIE